MALIIALGIAVVVVAYVALPFFLGVGRREGDPAWTGDGDSPLRDALAEKETLYAAIQELDFDFKSGKLSEADHQALRGKYENQAALVLMRIDELQGAARGAQGAQGAGKSKKERRKA